MNTALCLPETQQEQQLFNFEGQKIRVSIVDGEPRFIVTDVCRVLGLTNPSEALKRLYENEKG